MRKRYSSWGAVAAVLLASGCTHVLPAPPTPQPIPPPLTETPPLAEGHGRLIVDVVDGPTEVLTVHKSKRTFNTGTHTVTVRKTRTEPMCVSPCFFDLPYGSYVFGFYSHGNSPRLETSVIDVGDGTLVYRHALGSNDDPGAAEPLGIVAIVLGGMSLVTGTTLLPVGLAKDKDGMALAGWITLAAGASLTTVGIVTIAINPSRRQPGAWIKFPLP